MIFLSISPSAFTKLVISSQRSEVCLTNGHISKDDLWLLDMEPRPSYITVEISLLLTVVSIVACRLL
ncbi:hypothetical protein L2E82_38357 [Cichorium intybus]|uniref:Uncharacterized protein n=1 Tax=Cichorium intybus TaxID=13427 RepID=A0ACB9AH64_CICIN|nr:hypothetical protein L2E82_38357 [Cichorium intybus]